METKTRPCPFCKSSKTGLYVFSEGGVCVMCFDCGCRTGIYRDTSTTEASTVNAVERVLMKWNKRADDLEDAKKAEYGDFADRLSIEIEKRGITQRELAKMSGITNVTISRYINKSRIPKADNVEKIAGALGVTCDYLLGLSSNPHLTRKEECNAFGKNS